MKSSHELIELLGFALLKKPAHKSGKVTTRAILASLKFSHSLWMIITFENGKEFAVYEQITKTASIVVYFAHPDSSYEREINENTNGFIPQ